MNGTASSISRTSIHLVVFCSALFFTTANAEDQNAAGAPAGDLLEPPAEGSTGAWDKTKEVSGEAWDATKEGSAKAWDKTKEVSGEAWDATKEGSEKAWEKTKEVTHDTMEKISPSDPADTQDQEVDGITPASPTEAR
jgi:hypothetical protein